MKGVDSTATASTSLATGSTAVPGDEGWVADGDSMKRKDGSKKGKSTAKDGSRVEAVKEIVEEDDDDSVWLRRRQAALDGDGIQIDDRPTVSTRRRNVAHL